MAVLMLPCGVDAQSVKDLQKQQARLKKEIENTNNLLKQTTKSKTATVNKLELLNKNIQTQKRLIKNLDNEISALDKEMNALSTKRSELETEQQQLRRDYARLCRESHYAQMQQSPLLFLLSSDSFQQLSRRIRYMQEFGQYRRQQVAKIEGIQVEIDQQNALLKENRQTKEQSLKAQQRQKEELARDERKQKQMLDQLKKKEKNLKAELQKKQKKANELNKKIEEKIRQQAQAQSKQKLTKEQQLISGGFEANKGRMPWPVEKGVITGQFGKHQHPVYDQVTIDNKGIYIQAPSGSMARAVFDGEVTSCFVMNNTYAVIVQHGAYRTVYAGLSKLSVKQGDKIKAKQNLGVIYTDPTQDNKTELYFQVWNGKEIQNPSLWIAK
ncbi:MAG: peptidoglycan DD-metalloendopeptidase family protein [Paludibacteraceae bacterium]|jgi:septal ring factor EnvC (AmiA/AmiB activator)|nr:peptidoglycan DD-metalloendopeptidase family protein [Paludibacteraceae bacterium]MBP5642376.1 peptidoglycan DD-metalloendopeptidase family protein [Paludibacteraceae bacterium]